MAAWLPTLAALSIGTQVGLQITLTRSLATHIPPASLALLRYGIALGLLAPLALLGARVRFRIRDLLPIGVLGILNFGLMIAVQNEALRHLPAGRGSLIFATLPFFTMLLSAALGYERLTLAKAAGVMLTILGVGLVVGAGVISGAMPSWAGEGLMLLAAILAATCSVLYRPFVRRYPALAVSAIAILCADLCLLPAGMAEGLFGHLGQISMPAWFGLIALGASSAFFYWLWLWTLGRAAPTLVNVFQALGPVTAAGSAALFLQEALSATFALGTVIVMLGFVLAYRQPKPPAST